MAKRLQAPKEYASEWLLNTAEGDVGSWSALDESGARSPPPSLKACPAHCIQGGDERGLT